MSGKLSPIRLSGILLFASTLFIVADTFQYEQKKTSHGDILENFGKSIGRIWEISKRHHALNNHKRDEPKDESKHRIARLLHPPRLCTWEERRQICCSNGGVCYFVAEIGYFWCDCPPEFCGEYCDLSGNFCRN